MYIFYNSISTIITKVENKRIFPSSMKAMSCLKPEEATYLFFTHLNVQFIRYK